MTPALRAAIELLPMLKSLQEGGRSVFITDSHVGTLIAALEELKDMAVVPREPTEAMMVVGMKELHRSHRNYGDDLRSTYLAMIAEGEKE